MNYIYISINIIVNFLGAVNLDGQTGKMTCKTNT